MEEEKVFYKYLSLDKFERFVDILINKRLYAACYRDLNDPFEGSFNWRDFDRTKRDEIYCTIYNAKICSLVDATIEEVPKERLMWSHYANAHKGCRLKVRIVPDKEWEDMTIDYKGILPTITGEDIKKGVKSIFSHKTPEWDYENEHRFVKFFDKFHKDVFIKVEIEAVYFGLKVKSADKKFLYKLIHKIDPSIKIFVMKEEPAEDFYPSLIAIPYH